MSGSIPIRDQRLLAYRCGNRCAKCKTILVEDATDVDPESLLGYMAHIKGENPTSARYDSKMSPKERNQYPNLITLCGSCHKIVDDQRNTFTVEKLLKMKMEHEQWIIDSTRTEISNVTFAEVDVITSYLTSEHVENDTSLILIPQKEKIRKNDLSPSVESLIMLGMTKVKQVEEYLENSIDLDFGDRLKAGFVEEYRKLRGEGLIGDELFNELFTFSGGKKNNFTERAAGLAILVYFFEKCEIFEK